MNKNKLKVKNFTIQPFPSNETKTCLTTHNIKEKEDGTSEKNYGFISYEPSFNLEDALEGESTTTCPSYPANDPFGYCYRVVGAKKIRKLPEGWSFKDIKQSAQPKEITIFNDLKKNGFEWTYVYQFEDCGIGNPESTVDVTYEEVECLTINECEANLKKCCPELSWEMRQSKYFVLGKVDARITYEFDFEFEIKGDLFYSSGGPSSNNTKVTEEDINRIKHPQMSSSIIKISQNLRNLSTGGAYVYEMDITCKYLKHRRIQRDLSTLAEDNFDASETEYPAESVSKCIQQMGFEIPDPFQYSKERINDFRSYLRNGAGRILETFPTTAIIDGEHKGKHLQQISTGSDIVAKTINQLFQKEAQKAATAVKDAFKVPYDQFVIPSIPGVQEKIALKAISHLRYKADVETNAKIERDREKKEDSCFKCEVNWVSNDNAHTIYTNEKFLGEKA
jgi:hypothetical protein